MRIGVEVGGTFTDLVWEHDGKIHTVKVPSTPAQPDIGALAAIEQSAVDLSELRDLVHGSTIATNAILERKGARVGLLVTRGTRDVLLLQRHHRKRIYDLHYRKPEPVVRRRDIFEIDERIGADGRVIAPLQGEQNALLATLGERNYTALAICFLNSYVNPTHEQGLAHWIRDHFPNVPVTCSHEVNREFREYERCSTTALSAYVQPVVASYLDRFVAALSARGYNGPFSIMQSNGGRIPAAAMKRNAISALFSGPAAGVIGAVAAAARSGYEKLITLDMGGTSTDVCLIDDGRPGLAAMVEVDGLPIKTPVIDMVTVGAGGGSIVWLDDGGMLRIGPQSAGAEPGPACYNRGGRQPTLTDAHIVRGTLQADALLGGAMRADAKAAENAFKPLAAALRLAVAEVADSAIRLAEANIVRAIQRISTERGHDPRHYILVPFGGAGPMLAARLAEELAMKTVMVPPNAGVLSAYGLLASDYVHYETRTRRLLLDKQHLARIKETLAELAQSVVQQLAGLDLAGIPKLSATLEMRYVGQAFEIPVPVPACEHASLTLSGLTTAFNDAHRRVFEFDKGVQGQIEIVSFRVGGAIPPLSPPALSDDPVAAKIVPDGEISILERAQVKRCRRLQRQQLARRITGPALIEDKTSTLYLPEIWQAELDRHNNLILSHRHEDSIRP